MTLMHRRCTRALTFENVQAYKVGQMRGFKLSPLAQLHLATFKSAAALSLDHRIGNFLPGKEADFVVLDPCATPLMARRISQCSTLSEKLFVLTTMGDDRAVAAT
jgi:guanine deaminase